MLYPFSTKINLIYFNIYSIYFLNFKVNICMVSLFIILINYIFFLNINKYNFTNFIFNYKLFTIYITLTNL